MGIAAAVFKADFQMVLKDVLKQSMDRYNDNKSDKIAWNNVQTQVRLNNNSSWGYTRLSKVNQDVFILTRVVRNLTE